MRGCKILRLLQTGLRLRLNLGSLNFGSNLVQEVFSIIDNIFKLIMPLLHKRISVPLILCIVKNSVDNGQFVLQFLQWSIELLALEEVQHRARRHPIE
uniref:Putative disease resistance RPP13-like protein 1 n=1 Tax=Rhizophora mucronata TaxID=61149 RepID=A0A2P2MWI8_RHIMU